MRRSRFLCSSSMFVRLSNYLGISAIEYLQFFIYHKATPRSQLRCCPETVSEGIRIRLLLVPFIFPFFLFFFFCSVDHLLSPILICIPSPWDGGVPPRAGGRPARPASARPAQARKPGDFTLTVIFGLLRGFHAERPSAHAKANSNTRVVSVFCAKSQGW